MKKHIINDRDQDVRTVKTRLMISAVVMVVLAVTLLGRFFVLQVTHHDQYRMMSLDNQIDLRPLPPVRGMIFDRYGMVLAENQSVYELEVIPENVNDMDRMLSEIGMLVELTDQNIRRFRRNVKQRPRFESQILKSRLTDAEAARFAVRQHQFPGVTLSASLRRVYPQKDLAGHVVGYVGRVSEQDLKKIDTRAYEGTSYIGKIGIESFYETELLGQVGVQQVETDAYGRVVR
ncbi:MAG TPA: penicillin-binding protein 2, partial [Gammaproteobacteria bacterium]|nr:penicillin-binding protein 2 [Gammaproteobacteria bacterium]